jgi:hypothetical protein
MPANGAGDLPVVGHHRQLAGSVQLGRCRRRSDRLRTEVVERALSTGQQGKIIEYLRTEVGHAISIASKGPW